MNESNVQPCAPSVPQPSKRSFLAALLGVGAVGVGAVLSLPVLRFVLYPLLTRTTEIQWSDIGQVAELQPGSAPIKKLIQVEQRDGWRKLLSEKAVYVVQDKTGKLKCYRRSAHIWDARWRGTRAAIILSARATV